MKKFSPIIESLIALIVAAQLYFIISEDFKSLIPLAIIEAAVYILLTLLFSLMILGDTTYNINLSKLRILPKSLPYEITDEQKNAYLSKAAGSINSIKLAIILFMAASPLLETGGLFILVLLPGLLIGIFFAIYNFMKYSLYSRGYINIPAKEIWQKYIFYYNPNDSRAVLEKPLGVGSTVNLATSHGKLILGVILGVPLTIVILLFFIFYLTGQL